MSFINCSEIKEMQCACNVIHVIRSGILISCFLIKRLKRFIAIPSTNLQMSCPQNVDFNFQFCYPKSGYQYRIKVNMRYVCRQHETQTRQPAKWKGGINLQVRNKQLLERETTIIWTKVIWKQNLALLIRIKIFCSWMVTQLSIPQMKHCHFN